MAGLECFQVCENARPLAASVTEWRELSRHAAEMGLRLSLGCMTLDVGTVIEYLNRVEAIDGSYLRIVLEKESDSRLNVSDIQRFLDRILPEVEIRGLRLAIENHFEIPSGILAEAVSSYSSKTVGFCVDVANSLRNFEDTGAVLAVLGRRAICYHLKDYQVRGSNVGFSVSGTPFGEGQIEVKALLQRLLENKEGSKELFLETWTPQTGNSEKDIQLDATWLQRSIQGLQRLVPCK